MKKSQHSVFYLQDNSRPHVPTHTTRELMWTILQHLSHSLDFARIDFHLFVPLNEVVGGKKLYGGEEIVQIVGRPAGKDVRKLSKRWLSRRSLLEKKGVHVEK